MPISRAELEAILENGTVDQCIEFFAGVPEAERQPLGKACDKSLREFSTFDSNLDGPAQQQWWARQDVVRAAALATCSLSALKSLGWRVQFIDQIAIRVFADRKPDWLPEFAEYLLDDDNIGWMSVRAMMKAGLIGKPAHDNYVIGMTHYHMGVGGFRTKPADYSGEWTIRAHLDAEPDLLDEVWRLFELEGGATYSLAGHDKFSRYRWNETLVELSEQGILPRDRLLDASLEALDRGFAQFRAGWFSTFHELLKPSLDERRARLDRYAGLVSSNIPPTVSFALVAIETIDDAAPIPAIPFVEQLRPALLAKAKGTVKSTLKLLERIARREAHQAPMITRIVADALIHQASDVQLAAIKFIATYGDRADAELIAAVTAAQETAAPSVQKSLSDWLDATSQKTAASRPTKGNVTSHALAPVTIDESLQAFQSRIENIPGHLRTLSGIDDAFAALREGRLHFPALEFDGTEIPRLDPAKRLEPINSLEELIDLAARVIEKFDDHDEVELLFDGVSRLCDHRPEDFAKRTGPLLKRVRSLIKRDLVIPFIGHSLSSDILGILLAWLTGGYGTFRPIKLHEHDGVEYKWEDCLYQFGMPHRELSGGSLAMRSQQLADRVVQRIATATLCAPTHRDGWIEASVLVERAKNPALLVQATDIEKVLALLRLAPDRRDVALTQLPASKDEFLSALRYALGATVKKLGSTDWLWAAAARARHPFANDSLLEEAFPNLGPDGGTAAIASAKVMERRVEKSVFSAKEFVFHELNIEVQPPPAESVDPRLLLARMWLHPARYQGPEFVSHLGVTQTFFVWPIAQEAACATGAFALANNLDWASAEWQNRLYLPPLFDPDLPLRPMALLLLVLGLAAKKPGEHVTATDVAIAAIDDGRLDGVKLGAIMGQLLPTGLIKPGRWAKTLSAVSRCSLLHAEVIRIAIATSLRGDPAQMPKDLQALVELLKELVIETKSPVDEATRQFLSHVSSSRKLGKAAKAILAAEAEDNLKRRRSIQQQVLEHRLVRAERWTMIAATN